MKSVNGFLPRRQSELPESDRRLIAGLLVPLLVAMIAFLIVFLVWS